MDSDLLAVDVQPLARGHGREDNLPRRHDLGVPADARAAGVEALHVLAGAPHRAHKTHVALAERLVEALVAVQHARVGIPPQLLQAVPQARGLVEVFGRDGGVHERLDVRQRRARVGVSARHVIQRVLFLSLGSN